MLNRNICLAAIAALMSVCLLSPLSFAQGEKAVSIKLPAADQSGGKPLMAALKDRKSDRDFGMQALTDQQLADILWAAVGISRPEGTLRTAPTAKNKQDVELYAITAKGVFQYNALEHTLETIALPETDQTGLLGAPLALIYVTPADNRFGPLNVGFCAQNVYLYAASAGLNTVVKGTFPEKELRDILKIGPDKTIVLVQPVGPRP